MSEFALRSESTYFSPPIHQLRRFYDTIAPSEVAVADALEWGR
jgi:hypothetical protein